MVAQRREDRHFLHMQQFSFVGFFSSLDVVSGDFFFRSAFELFLEAALPFAELLLCCSHQRSCELNPIERSVVFFFRWRIHEQRLYTPQRMGTRSFRPCVFFSCTIRPWEHRIGLERPVVHDTIGEQGVILDPRSC